MFFFDEFGQDLTGIFLSLLFFFFLEHGDVVTFWHDFTRVDEGRCEWHGGSDLEGLDGLDVASELFEVVLFL